MSQTQTVGSHKTVVFTEQGVTKVVYHHTCVVAFGPDGIVLNSGGWLTTTTKTRMNQASSQFDLGFRVVQKDFDWFVEYNGETLDFYDGITLTR